MALPVPDLDDRRFQDLVDDAKRIVQKRCPEWSDHNVSDPGVTLIETFAFMVDQLLWRLNRVPDRLYVKFLEMLGMQLFPPNAARADVTFWLSGARSDVFTVPAGTIVTTARTEQDEAIEFTTLGDLAIVPCSLSRLAVESAGFLADETVELGGRDGVRCFGLAPRPGDAFYVALPEAVPSCVVVLRFQCAVEGVGVDPDNPPIVWEAWDGSGWAACDLQRDETSGFNQAGDVIVHVPASHVSHRVARTTGGWLRCRTVNPEEWQPFYSASPLITRLDAFTMGGTIPAVHARVVADEVIGTSEGVAGQVFPLQCRPVVEIPEIPVRLETTVGTGWVPWTVVENFAASGPDDFHYLLDAAAGEIRFGPAVNLADGTMRQFGRIPPAGASVRIRRYCTGGGREGNVGAGVLSLLRSPMPYIDRVVNRRPASGGVDGETIENAKLRGPLEVRSCDRAVTTGDYEHLAREAAVEVARVRCLSNGDADRRNAIWVLVVPHVSDGPHGAVDLAALAPSEDLLSRVAGYLDERRTVGSRVAVEPPRYMAITVTASLRCRPHHDPQALQGAALDALYGYFHPLRGGPEGSGWAFGRPVNRGEVYSVLQALPGLDYIDEVRLYPANPLDGHRGDPVERLELGPDELIFSFGHQIRVLS